MKTEAARRACQKWAANNKEKVSEKNRNHRKKYLKKAILKAAKNRCQKFNIEFNLTEDDFELPEVCPVLGIPLQITFGNKGGGKDNSYSLDRINPSLGYIKGNVQVISLKANMMKSSATKEELIKFSKWIKQTYE